MVLQLGRSGLKLLYKEVSLPFISHCMGYTIVERFHGEGAGQQAREGFEAQFAKKETPDDVPEASLPAEDGALWIIRALTQAGLTASNGEAIRMVKQNALSINGVKMNDKDHQLKPGGPYLIKLGKRKFLNLTVVRSGHDDI